MASDIEICSNALLMLGAKPIASFTEAMDPNNLDRATLCANLYPMVKKSLLRAHPWNCATKRVQLSPDQTAPAFGYAYRFELPGDWLRTLAVGDQVRLDFKAEGKYLLCDERVFPLVYIADVPEQDWDSLLVEGMTRAMAAVLSYPITTSTSNEQLKVQEFNQFMKGARAVNGQDDPPETFGDYPLLSSRFGGFRFASQG